MRLEMLTGIIILMRKTAKRERLAGMKRRLPATRGTVSAVLHMEDAGFMWRLAAFTRK